MSKKNRQSIRSQEMLRIALIELLNEKPLHKIRISEITDRADLARSTFYTHFETKEDLLLCCFDEILVNFFDEVYEKKGFNGDEETDIETWSNFFRLWSESAELTSLLEKPELAKIIIDRLRTNHFNNYKDNMIAIIPELNPTLAGFYVQFLAFTDFALLRHWIDTGMEYPPEVMGRLMNELGGVSVAKRIAEKFKDTIN